MRRRLKLLLKYAAAQALTQLNAPFDCELSLGNPHIRALAPPAPPAALRCSGGSLVLVSLPLVRSHRGRVAVVTRLRGCHRLTATTTAA